MKKKDENAYTISPDTLKDLINEAVKLSEQGDFHLEHFNGAGDRQWGASTCFLIDPERIETTGAVWYFGRTPESAVRKLIKALKKK